VVEGNSKLYARVKILRTVVEKLSKELNYDPFESPDGDKKKRKKK
jgi:hypothetical protein